MKKTIALISALLMATSVLPQAAVAQQAEDVFRLNLKAPIYFGTSDGSTNDPDDGPPGAGTNNPDDGDPGEGPPGAGTNDPGDGGTGTTPGDDDGGGSSNPPGAGTNDPGDLDVDLQQLALRGCSPLQIPVSVTGGTGPYVVTFDDAPELTYNASTGRITGTLTATSSAYTRTINVRVVDSLGAVHLESFALTVHPVFTATVAPTTYTVVAGSPLTVTPSSSNGVGTVSWAKGSGTWPAGLNVVGNSLTGTPTVASTYANLRLVAQDSIGTTQTGTFTITVTPAPVNASVASGNLTSGRLHLQNLFSSADWTSTAPKTVTIPSGMTVGSSSTSTPAVTTGTGWGGTLTLINEGTIVGAGGAGGSSSVGGNGGVAIEANANGLILINRSTGRIYGGGGGGGAGGSGGKGSGETTSSAGPYTGSYYCEHWHAGHGKNRKIIWGGSTVWSTTDGSGFPSGKVSNGNSYSCGAEYSRDASTVRYKVVQTSYSMKTATGGSGGRGGDGAGYNKSVSNGASGSAGTTNSPASGGSGGKGGNGGALGVNGNSGVSGNAGNGSLSHRYGSGGHAGGSAGASVKNRGWVSIQNAGVILPAP